MKKQKFPFPQRSIILFMGGVVGVLFIAIMSLILPEKAAIILLDRSTELFPYPFTIQNLMLMLFFVSLAELYVRWTATTWERSWITRNLLPEDHETVLQISDLSPIRLSISETYDTDSGFLPSMMDLSIQRFQASRSADQTVNVLNTSLELWQNRVELRYNMLRYLVWVIPTFGFIGTVVGISWSLSTVNPEDVNLEQLTTALAVAFNTTLIALLLSSILVFFLHLVQGREEQCLNMAGEYCLRNLINRLYTGHTS